MAEERTQPSRETEGAEADEARSGHSADRPPTADEERAAEQADDLDPAVAEKYKEAIERGAEVKGEGEIS